MSNSKQEAAEGTVASLTHKQTRIRVRDSDDEEKQPAAPSSAHVSPAMRIYRHALESIFAMLELSDLSRVVAVSRSFAGAVRSMRPILASIQRVSYGLISPDHRCPFPPIASIVGSPLLRHLGAIHAKCTNNMSTVHWTPLTNESLCLLAQHAPNLQSLRCDLTLTPNESLVLPAKLQSLKLRMGPNSRATTIEYADAVINGVLTTLAALPALSSLCLGLAAWDGDETYVELGPLATSPSLTNLTLVAAHGGAPKLSVTQLDQIRSSLGHLRRLDVGPIDSSMLTRLLKPPVTARWQDIGFVWADERTGELLLRLPSLTRLDLWYEAEAAQVDFLPQLPHLTVISLDCYDEHGEDDTEFVPADALLASVMRCTGITDLNLRCGFDSAQWSSLLAKRPLKKLAIRGGAMHTLRCFAGSPIAESLEWLTLGGQKLPPSEVSHLYALRRLRTLELGYCFASLLNGATLDSLSPPTSHLPALTALTYLESTARDSRERRGPSFEWMQQRRTR